MERLTAQEVSALPLNDSEREHRSRRRRAFDVFVSRGVCAIKSMEVDAQREMFFGEMGYHAGVGDNDSVSSSDSLYYELMERPLKYVEMKKVLCRYWDRMGAERKAA